MTTIHLTDAQRDTFAACGLIVIDGESPKNVYDVTWARSDGELQTCHRLDLRTAVARMIGAIRNSGPITVHQVARTVGPLEGWRILTEPCDTCGGEVLLSGKFGVDPLGLKVCPDCAGGRRVVTLTATCRWCKAKAINHPHKEAGHEGVVTLGRFTILALWPVVQFTGTQKTPPGRYVLLGSEPDDPATLIPNSTVLLVDPKPRPGQFVARPEPIPTQQGETP